MNRRRFLAAVGGSVAAAGGYAGLRVADYRRYEPGEPGGETPRDRVVAAARHRFAADHRGETLVRVTDDSDGEGGYDCMRYREWHEHSRLRHTHDYTTFRRPRSADSERIPPPLPGLPALFHWAHMDDEPPHASVLFVTDGLTVADFEATAVGPEQRPAFGTDTRAGVSDEGTAGMFGERIRPHDAAWSVHERDGARTTYELTGRDAYARAVPLRAHVDALDGGCRLRVTLDGQGRLRRIADRRRVVYEYGDTTRRIGYTVTAEFDAYGRTTAPRPRGSVQTDAGTRAQGLIQDFQRY